MNEIQQRERQDNRFDVNSQTSGRAVIVPAAIRELKETPMQCLPENLVHFAEIVGGGVKCPIAEERPERDQRNVDHDTQNGQPPGQPKLRLVRRQALPEDAQSAPLALDLLTNSARRRASSFWRGCHRGEGASGRCRSLMGDGRIANNRGTGVLRSGCWHSAQSWVPGKQVRSA